MRALSEVNGNWHAAERQRRDHRLIGGRELGEQPFDRVPEQRAAPRVEGFLIDDEDEAAAGVDAVVGAIGRVALGPVHWATAAGERS